MIDALRAKHDPHYKLSGKVEGLEKGISDQVSQIHKTISKSFVTQRKTLTRVLGLEKRVNHLEIQEATEQQAQENLDEVLSDIYGEKEVGGTKTKPKAKKKKKPKAKKSKISASAFKKGTSQESLEERVERIAQNKVDEVAADLHRQTSEYQETATGVDSETGEALSPEERKRRFKLKKGTISTSKFFDKDEPKALPGGQKGGRIVEISNSVTSIVETLKEDQKQDKKQQSWFRKTVERFKRRKKENKLEFKVFDGIKKTATKLLAPMKNAWSSFLGFIGKVILGRILFKILKWMGNKDNQGKLQSIIKFFEDWWPTMLAAYLLFGNAFGRMAVKMGVMVAKFAVRLVSKIIPQLIKGLAKMKIGKLLKNIPGGGKLAPLIQGGMMIGGGMLIENMMTGGDAQDFSGEFEGIQQEFKTGGFVSGPGGVDQVPARLTAGAFVMSKGAVQKYGANTLAAMNAAGGGTNKPTIMRGYEEGGSPQEIEEEDTTTKKQLTREDIVAATGPSLMVFMEQQNAAVDENPEAFNGIKLNLDRDGKMPNFGEFIMNQGEAEFNKGIAMLQNNEAVEPEIKEALLKKALLVRRQTLENPNFKGDIAFDINKDIPGTAANRLFLKAQADTTSAAARAGISAEDRARQMNRRGYVGGGLVQAASNIDAMRSSAVGSTKFSGSQLKNLLEEQKGIGGRSGASKKMEANITPRKTATVITPSEKKKVTVAYEEEKQKMSDKQNPEPSEQKIPHFDVMLYRSSPKIKLLGISV